MNDVELLNDMLMTEKNMVKNYSAFITETSCPNMRRILSKNMMETAEDQHSIFEMLKQKGFYEVKDAPDNEVTAAKQKLGGMRG